MCKILCWMCGAKKERTLTEESSSAEAAKENGMWARLQESE